MSLRIRRGTDAERQGLTFDLGEIVWTTDTRELWVGDGITQGGVNPAASLAGVNLTFNTQTNKLDVSNLTTDAVAQGQNNRYFSSELAQAATASLFQNGTHTGITFVYDDSQNKINATVTVEGSGTFNLLDDTTPELGGDLGLNGNDITGSGNIDVIGNIEATGTLYIGTGLASDLILNSHNITGSGNIQNTGTFWATQGLGGNLILNTHDITGTGGIDITGDINATTMLLTSGLGGALYLNGHNIEGTGNISITGDIGVVNGSIITNEITSTGLSTITVLSPLTIEGNVTAETQVQSPTVWATSTLKFDSDLTNGLITVNSTEIYNSTSVSNVKVSLDANFNLEGKLIAPLGDTESTAMFNVFVSNTGVDLKVLDDAPLYASVVKAHNGTNFVDSSALAFVVDGAATTGASSIPTKFSIFLGDGVNGLGSGAATLNFDKTGTLSVPILQTGVYTDTPETRPTGVKGMIIFNDTTGKFQGFNGSGWVDLS